jgi:hypothetical protein
MKKLMGVVFAMFLATSVMADPFLEDTIALAKHKFQKEERMFQATQPRWVHPGILGEIQVYSYIVSFTESFIKDYFKKSIIGGENQIQRRKKNEESNFRMFNYI